MRRPTAVTLRDLAALIAPCTLIVFSACAEAVSQNTPHGGRVARRPPRWDHDEQSGALPAGEEGDVD